MMADSSPKVEVLRIRDPRLQIDDRAQFVARTGGANVVTQRYSAQSVSPSVVRWSLVSPGLEYGLERHVAVEASFLITANGAPVDAGFGAVQTAGPRAFPLHSVTRNVQATLNGLSVTSQISDPIHALLEYGWTPDDRQYYASATPHQEDFEQTYGAMAGVNRNPFESYGNSLEEDSRGPAIWLEQADATTLRLRVREMIMVSPFLWGEKRGQALFNVSQIGMTLSFDDLRRVVSGQAAGVIGPAGTAFFDNAGGQTIADLAVVPEPDSQYLHLTYLTPQATEPVPRSLIYPYSELFDYSTRSPVQVAGGASTSVVFNNITLTTLPKRLYIFARRAVPTDAQGAVEAADAFARIDRLSMNFANQAGRFSTQDSYDLYRMSSKNGLRQSWPAWSAHRGSVLCIEMAEDLTMANPYLVESTQGNYQLSFTLDVTDLRAAGAAASTYEVHVSTIQTGVITSDGEIFSSQVGVLTEQMVAESDFVAPSGRVETDDYLSGGGVVKDVANAAAKRLVSLWAKAALPSGVASAIGKVAGGVRSTGGAMSVSGPDIAARLRR